MFLFKRNLFRTHRVPRLTGSVARSADRIVRLHHLYTTVDPREEQPLRAIFRRELRILVKRVLRLYPYLVFYRKKSKREGGVSPTGGGHVFSRGRGS